MTRKQTGEGNDHQFQAFSRRCKSLYYLTLQSDTSDQDVYDLPQSTAQEKDHFCGSCSQDYRRMVQQGCYEHPIFFLPFPHRTPLLSPSFLFMLLLPQGSFYI